MTTNCAPETWSILGRVRDERNRQNEKWGEQNHPWANNDPFNYWLDGSFKDEEHVKQLVGALSKYGCVTYADILFEEVAEAFSATDLEHVKEELIQIAAVAVAAVESIERNGR